MKKILELISVAKCSNEGSENRKTLAALEALATEVEKLQKAAPKKK